MDEEFLPYKESNDPDYGFIPMDIKANMLQSNKSILIQQFKSSTCKRTETRRFRRTLSFINTKRKRASQFCTLKRKANRRLSLNPTKKQKKFKSKETQNISSEDSFNNSIPMEFDTSNKDLHKNYRRFSNFNPTSSFLLASSSSTSLNSKKSNKFKGLKSVLKRRSNYEATLQLLQKQTLFDIDQRLRDFIQNQSDLTTISCYQNEELNNKIDLEIRILDGILKLLNAICSSSSLAPANINSSAQSSFAQNSNAHSLQNSIASMLISNLDIKPGDDANKCSTVGAEIAAAIMTNRLYSDNTIKINTSQSSNSSLSNNSSTATLSSTSNSHFDSTDPIFQILSACKCLYVSHRKIAIYLQNLQDLEKRNLLNESNSKLHKRMNISGLVESSENQAENSLDNEKTRNDTKNAGTPRKNNYSSLQKPKAPLANLTLNLKNESSTNTKMQSISETKAILPEFATTKIMLKDIRIPLVWKWSDHLKSIKNTENVNAKFATFAIIHLGNMIYDTQLISNIDPSITDITFNETFIFDDVNQSDFEITIELYSYELFNTGNNILQSAKKLAKTLTDFATFKRNSHNGNQVQQQQSGSGLNTLPNQTNTTSNSNNYSYSMHKFKLIGRAKLNGSDISEDIETKPLQLINESNLDQSHSNLNGSSNGNLNIQSQSNSMSTQSTTSHSATTKLPLFDFYSCCLCYAPTSTYI